MKCKAREVIIVVSMTFFIVTNLKNIGFRFWSYVLNLKNTTAQGCHVVYLMT